MEFLLRHRANYTPRPSKCMRHKVFSTKYCTCAWQFRKNVANSPRKKFNSLLKQMKQMNGKVENDILFSKSVKAGKRIYYIDVKRDRHDELYLSLTESKRIKEGTEELRPVFEKHKIFLYREDLEKFLEAFTEASQFAIEKQPAQPRYSRYDESYVAVEEEVEEATTETEVEQSEEIKLGELEF